MYSAIRPIRSITTINISKDHYNTLGISLASSHKEIRNAYLTLAKRFHPDSPTGKENIFKEIGEAYEILGNKRTRLEYDSRRTREKGFKRSENREMNRSGMGFRSAELHEDYRYTDPYVNSGSSMRYSYSQYKKDYHNLYFSDNRPKVNQRMQHYSSYTPGSSYSDSSFSPKKQHKKSRYTPFILLACGFYVLSLAWHI